MKRIMAWFSAHPLDLIAEPLRFSENRPDRRFLRRLDRHFHLATRGVVGLIVMLSIDPSLWWIGLVAIAGYLVLVAGLNALEKAQTKWASSGHLKVVKALALIVGITAFICATRFLSNASGARPETDLLWLLYVLAVYILSLHGSRRQAVVMVAVSAVGLLLANGVDAAMTAGGITPKTLGRALSITLVELIWLSVLSFILYALVRLLMDRSWDQELLRKIQTQISRSIDTLDDQSFLNEVVKSISAHCGYEHVNFFLRQIDGSLMCVAAASENGQLLIRERLRLQPDQGIIGRAMATGAPYSANRVERDIHYLPHPAFPNTRAELAAPVSMGGETIGVLDVQDDESDVFSEQDETILQLIAQLVSDVYRQLRSKHLYRRLERLAYSMPAQMLSHRELDEILNEIARTALAEFMADIVVVFARNPLTGEIERRAQAGELRASDHPAAVERGFHLAQRLMAEQESYHFHHDISQYRDHPIFGAGNREHEEQPGFVEREGIRSRVICCLGPVNSRVGIMFLNFREPRQFKSEEERAPFSLFAHLAATAIQNAQTQQQEILLERERLSALLHDQVKNTLYYANQTLIKVLQNHKRSDADLESLRYVKRNIADARRTINYLTRTGQLDNRQNAPNTLQAVVDEAVDNARAAFATEFEVQWSGEPAEISPDALMNIRLVIEEAITNAIMHGQARRIDLGFACRDHALTIDIRDNGCGFDPQSVREHGLAHMRRRIGRLHGRLEIDSRPGHGARIHAELPLNPARS